MDTTKQLSRTILMCVALCAVTFAAYWPVTGCGFINFDDPDYVVRNSHVISGLRWQNVLWAFQTSAAGNWHPATWVSHMLDCQLYGLRAAGHHVTNLLFHIANTLLLFGLLLRATRLKSVVSSQWSVVSSQCAWPSFFVAALFALHPMHVESVAWVSERKDVLSTFCFLLTLWAYVRYAEARSPRSEVHGPQVIVHGPQSSPRASHFTFHAPRFYLLSLLFLAFGLMSKPMLVTVPFVLLLLDYWPLGRFAVQSPESTVHSPRSTASPDGSRITHHFSRSTCRLLIEKVPFLALAAASCVVTFIVQRAAGAVASLQTMPLGFRVSNALVSYVRYALKMLWPAKLAVFYPEPVQWPLAWVACAALLLAGVSALALHWARKAPWFAVGWFWYLGTLVPVIGIVQVGNQSMADRYSYIPLIGLFVAIAWGAAAAAARWPWSRSWLAVGGMSVLLVCGVLTWRQVSYWQSSTSLFEHALAVTRGNYVAHYNIASVLMQAGDAAGAEGHLAEAVRLKPYDADARYSFGVALAGEQKARQAIEQYREALKLRPDFPETLNNLAWILAANSDSQVRNGGEAVQLAERACKLTRYQQPLLVGTLAAAYAEAGRFADAVAMAGKAQKLAEEANEPELIARNRELGELYRAGKTARDER